MPAQLRIIRGPEKGKSQTLDGGKVYTIGRSKDNDVGLLDEKASRKHCQIQTDRGSYILTDLNSLNGTFVDGQRVVRKVLSHGDRIWLGSTEIQFLVESPPRGVHGLVAAGTLVTLAALVRAVPVGRALPWLAAASVLLAAYGVARRHSDDRSRVTIASSPSPAMAFVDGEYVGQTPVAGILVPRGRHLIRLNRHGYQPYAITVETLRADTPIQAHLMPLPVGTLEIQSKPSGAEISLDGEFKGKTPLTIPNLSIAEHDLRLAFPEYMPVQEKITLADSTPVRREITLKHEMIQFYEDQIRREPENVAHYTDVAHLYLLNQQFDEAVQALESAVNLVTEGRDPGGYAPRVHQEITKAYNADHYEYGDFQAVARVRTLIEEMMERVTDRYPAHPVNYKLLLQFYQQAGRADKMAALQEKGYRRIPEDWNMVKGHGSTLLNDRKFAEAKKVFAEAKKLAPGNWDAHYMYGVACLRGAENAEQRAEAAASLQTALDLCPKDGPKDEIRRLLEQAKAGK
jgi:tetratricopeptide (TPR) repeat protein